mmetsp:Transcript_7480/g.8498  ORF Transcript_7480/g.8498 Transcript_7480/m.8498 type:complete len:80 (+) Transcript_7480:954-1193(+)
MLNSDIIESWKGNSQPKVFVHCAMGRSRSATLIMMYLMKKYNLSYQNTENLVKSRREEVEINCGFSSQLEDFEENLLEF